MSNLIFKHKSCRSDKTRGVTLVELLIVVSILSVIAAIMIPKLRVVNKDRNIREASRIVAGAIAKAVNRASVEGLSGLAIVPNPNFQGGTFWPQANNDLVYFAGTRIFQMRRLPPYIGDDEGALAMDASTGGTIMVSILKPLEHDPSANRQIINQFDEISFNGSSYRYLISSVTPSSADPRFLNLTINNRSAPAPNLGTDGVPYVIHRRPRRLESSMVELPDGYMIDLRYSGEVIEGANANYGTAINQNAPTPNAGEIEIHFNGSGGVERMFFYDQLTTSPPGITQSLPVKTLYWFVTEYEPSAFNDAGLPISAGRDPIMNPSSKWVTLDPVTGSVNVASNAIPSGNGSLANIFTEAQAIARTRQSANQ